jgi:hypothetical protein
MTPKESWYRLSKDEQGKIFAKSEALLKQVGGKSIVMCNSGWSNEKWAYFGLEEFPDAEAVQKHAQLQEEINMPFQFVESFSILGTKMA